MNTLQELEKELAELLGWTGLQRENHILMGMRNGHTLALVPKWCSDNAAAFELMVEHNVEVTSYSDDGVSTYIEGNASGTYCTIEDFANKAEALRVSIVASVVSKLKESK